jgi:hypothetical protein
MSNKDSERKFYSLQKLANTYKLLEKRKPPSDQEFVIYAYFLFSETKDGRHGKQIYLGAYPTKRRALEEVEKIIKETGHDSIYVTEACNWEDIDESKNPDRTLYMDPDTKAHDLEEQYRFKITKEAEADEKREMISKELDEQLINELNPNTVEHYAHNWFNAIRNKANYEHHKQEMEYYKQEYEKRVTKIREQYNNHPKIDETWLEIYKNRLVRRGEEDVFLMMEQGYKVLSSEILKNVD